MTDPGPQPGDRLKLAVTALGFGGQGLAVHDSGLGIRVPKTLPGERVTAEVVRRTPKWARARLLRVVEPSPLRVTAPCRHFDRCGGCALQHLAYQDQLAHKTAALAERLHRKLGEAAAALLGGLVPAPAPLGYRTRNLFAVHGPTIGFVDPLAREVLDVDQCPLATADTGPLLGALRQWLRATPGAAALGLLGVMTRTGPAWPMVVLVLDAGRATVPQLTALASGAPQPHLRPLLDLFALLPPASVWASPRRAGSRAALGKDVVHLCGPDHVVEELGPFALLLSPRSFTQVHPQAAAALYERATAELSARATDEVLDLYSGSGALALHLARTAGSVQAVELSHPACLDLQRSAVRNGVHNVAVRNGRAEVIGKRLFLKGRRFRTATVNPPRTGLHAEVPRWLQRLGVEQLCYLSCSPATLVRDLLRLRELGYRLRSLRAFDLFPQTWHLEVLARLER